MPTIKPGLANAVLVPTNSAADRRSCFVNIVDTSLEDLLGQISTYCKLALAAGRRPPKQRSDAGYPAVPQTTARAVPDR